MKRKDVCKGFGVALALFVVLNLAWKPICRAIPWHLLPFEISMSKDAKVDMIQSYLDKYYVEDIDQGKLEDTLFAGMLAGVGDKYTYYMPKENLRQYLTNTNGNFDGVGIEIYTTQDGEVVISSVMPGQPAERSGIWKFEIRTIWWRLPARGGSPGRRSSCLSPSPPPASIC